MNAIIYTTNTGSTERYARLLAKETGLPAYSLAEAKKRVFAGAEVIYLGWIMAGSACWRNGYENRPCRVFRRGRAFQRVCRDGIQCSAWHHLFCRKPKEIKE